MIDQAFEALGGDIRIAKGEYSRGWTGNAREGQVAEVIQHCTSQAAHLRQASVHLPPLLGNLFSKAVSISAEHRAGDKTTYVEPSTVSDQLGPHGGARR